MSITPVFLLSLPRSGSTLTQRVLAAHEGVATASEPWLLLPLLSPLDAAMPLNAPWDRTVAGALADFLDSLPDGRADYEREVRALALRLYERAAGPGARWFVDKTPPYHLVADQLIPLFPAGRFVFLWRNPLSVLASIVETLGDGRWCTYRFRGDLFHGVENLVRAFERHRDRVHAVRYEDLVTAREPWEALAAYLGFELDPRALSAFSDVRLDGRMGDPTGVHRYRALSAEPLDKWRRTLANPVRRGWARRWLRWIGRERLAAMGYDLDALVGELDALPVARRGMLADSGRVASAAAREAVKSRLPGQRLYSTTAALLSVRR